MPTLTNQSQEKTLVPEGTHLARCYQFMHYGHIKNYFGEIRDTIRFTFELPNVTHVFKEENGEQPMSISREYNNFLGDTTTLKAHLEAWRGKAFTTEELAGFDVENVVGAACMITVIHKTSNKGKVYDQITGITALPEGIKCPDQVNPTFIWNYNDHFDLKVLENLNKYFQEIIKGSEEYRKLLEVDVADSASFPTADMPEDVPPPDDIDPLPF
jgi:hypothetical protein